MIFEILYWLVVALGIVAALWLLARMIETASYEKPAGKSLEFVEQSCANCLHSEISVIYPKLACRVIGKHVEPHHHCKDWK